MGIGARFMSWLGWGDSYASVYSDNSHLEDITLEDWLGTLPSHVKVNRSNAMKVAAVDAARQAIAPTVGRLEMFATQRGARVLEEDQPAILSQVERGVPLATTMTWTADALLFNPSTWWVVRDRDFYEWPKYCEWIDRGRAELDSKGRLLRVDGEAVRAEDVIRFDSPLGEGLLTNASDAIKRSIAIAIAAAKAEDNPVPVVELHNEGVDLDDDERETLLEAWAASRRKRGVGYTSKNLKVIPHGQHVEQLLVEGRKALNLEVLRHASLPAWAASTAVEGATMQYDNRQSRNWELIDLTLAAYFKAISGRLSLNDVTPRGWKLKYDLDELTRPDQKARFEAYALGKKNGFIDNDWIAEQEGWVTVPASQPARKELTQ